MEARTRKYLSAMTTGILALLLSATLFAQEFGGRKDPEAFEKPSYSPYAGRSFPDTVYWGDTHLHTTLSFDAGAFGNRLGPEEAYEFARGGEITATSGFKVRLSRPLDFLVVADHSDNMGLFTRIFESHPDIMSDADGRRIHDAIKAGGQEAVQRRLQPPGSVLSRRRTPTTTLAASRPLSAMNGHLWSIPETTSTGSSSTVTTRRWPDGSNPIPPWLRWAAQTPWTCGNG